MLLQAACPPQASAQVSDAEALTAFVAVGWRQRRVLHALPACRTAMV